MGSRRESEKAFCLRSSCALQDPFGFDYYPNLNDGQGEAYYCKNVQNAFKGGRSRQLQSSHYYKLAGKVDCA